MYNYMKQRGVMRGFWILDAQITCVEIKILFSSLDITFSQTVKLGNNTRMRVIRKGTVKLYLHGVFYSISNMYRIPELTNNLLRIGHLQEKGLHVLFTDGACNVYHPQKGKMEESTISANWMIILLDEASSKYIEARCLQINNTDQSTICHYLYVHLSYKGLRTLKYKNMVKGLPQIVALSATSDGCLNGKQHQTPICKRGH